MANTEENKLAIREKRKEISKEVIKGGIKFCVGAFFGAIAAYITKDSDAPKFERYAAVAGGMIVGSFVGDQAGEQVCVGIDNFAERWSKIKKQNEEAVANG